MNLEEASRLFLYAFAHMYNRWTEHEKCFFLLLNFIFIFFCVHLKNGKFHCCGFGYTIQLYVRMYAPEK